MTTINLVIALLFIYSLPVYETRVRCRIHRSVLWSAVVVLSFLACGGIKHAITAENFLPGMRGGPIEIRLAKLAATAISMDVAIQNANQHLGLTKQPQNSWQVVVTDQEYMGDLVKERPCWLFEYAEAVMLPKKDKPEQATSLFVVIDAQSGFCWEVFTMPQAPWWDRVVFKNNDVVKRFKSWRYMASPSPAISKIPFLTVIEGLKRDGFLSPYVANSEQIIARHFNYTTGGEGTAVYRNGGLEIIPKRKDLPTWFISLEGVNMPHHGSQPRPNTGKPAAPVKIEEMNVAVSAVTGEILSIGDYR